MGFNMWPVVAVIALALLVLLILTFFDRKSNRPKNKKTNSQEGITVLGPELFASEDDNVISWRGENYYRACDKFVSGDPKGAASYCVKRRDHPSIECEDYEGRTRIY